MKEWRLDRLLEHFRREGWIRMWIGILRRPRFPVWTAKAILIAGTSFVLTLAAAAACLLMHSIVATPLLFLLQPLIVFVAWLLWKPVDTALRRRMFRWAARNRQKFKNVQVIGIVGSVGKTTTKELLRHVLASLYPTATPEHVNTELGVAQWFISVGENVPVVIVEMGAYRAGEIALLSSIMQPTIAVVTALGSDHLALFGSEEAIVDANAEILDAIPASGHVFLLGDNDSAKNLKKRSKAAVTIAGSADATEIRDTDRGLTFDSNGTRFTVALHGMHNVGNTMLAIAVARHMGIPDDLIREALARFRPSAHTFHLKTERGVTILDDTYNVSPLSFKAAIDWAKGRPERPRTLLTSGLLETGASEDAFLQDLGKAAKKHIERVVFTTKNGADAFAKTFGPVEVLDSNTKAVTDDSLLVCIGRMPLSTIQQLLPNQ